MSLNNDIKSIISTQYKEQLVACIKDRIHIQIFSNIDKIDNIIKSVLTPNLNSDLNINSKKTDQFNDINSIKNVNNTKNAYQSNNVNNTKNADQSNNIKTVDPIYNLQNHICDSCNKRYQTSFNNNNLALEQVKDFYMKEINLPALNEWRPEIKEQNYMKKKTQVSYLGAIGNIKRHKAFTKKMIERDKKNNLYFTDITNTNDDKTDNGNNNIIDNGNNNKTDNIKNDINNIADNDNDIMQILINDLARCEIEKNLQNIKDDTMPCIDSNDDIILPNNTIIVDVNKVDND